MPGHLCLYHGTLFSSEQASRLNGLHTQELSRTKDA